jgi:1-acyl-sn-glycerol-3-phosphate acyltransferase
MGALRLIYRLPLMLLHLFLGLPLTLLSYTPPLKAIRLRGLPLNHVMLFWFSGTTCRIFGLQRHITGQFTPGAQLVAANHISWLDIQLLHSESPMGFVAKAEIQNWPIAGFAASVGETVFHRRGSHDSASGVSAVMAERLRQGSKVAIFPEGGILPGDDMKRFHARLFAAAIETGSPVQPVMIRYRRDGRHYPGMTFLPGENFITNFFRLLRQKPCVAELCVLPLIDSGGMQRRDLAQATEQAVRAAYEREGAESGNG